MNYSRIYQDLISKAKIRIRPNGYSEKHHIVPRCLGGTNENSNLIRLTAREHFIAHILLMKMNPNNHKLVWAAHMMSKGFKRLGGKSILFASVRERYAKESSKYFKGKPRSEELKEKLRQYKGYKHHGFGKKRPDHSKKISGDKNPMFGRCRIGEFAGEKNGMFGKGYLVLGENNPMFKGYYITPAGKFGSSYDAAKALNISRGTVVNRCKSSSNRFIDWRFEPK